MKILGNVIKSPNDSRVYIATQLKNGIECLIISDREAKKSSAAMSVGVGSFQDPF
jgi:protease-3